MLDAVEGAFQAKQDAVEYFQSNGTLKGFGGKLPSISDIEDSVEEVNTPTKDVSDLSDEELLRGF